MVRVSEEPSQAGGLPKEVSGTSPQSSPAGSVTSVEELKPQAIIVPQLFRLTLAKSSLHSKIHLTSSIQQSTH